MTNNDKKSIAGQRQQGSKQGGKKQWKKRSPEGVSGSIVKTSPQKKSGAGKKGKLVVNALTQALSDQFGMADGLAEKVRELESKEENYEVKETVVTTIASMIDQPTPVDGSIVHSTITAILPTDVDYNVEYMPQREEVKVTSVFGGVKARAMAHFGVVGHSEKTLSAALAKATLWMDREGLKLTEDNVKKTHDIIFSVYASRYTVGTWFDRVKLAIYDYWLSCIGSTKWWLGMGTLAGVGVGIGLWMFGLGGITVAGLTVAGISFVLRRHLEQNDLIEEDCEYISDYCTETVDVPEICEGAKVQTPSEFKCQECKFAVGFTICPTDIWIPRLCTHNELNALCYRQLLPAIGTPDGRETAWKTGLHRLTKDLPLVLEENKDTPEEKLSQFLEKYPLNRRKQIEAGYIKVNGTYHIGECITKAFVKREWLVGKVLEKRNPRLISGKTDEYLAETGPDYYHMMKHVCKTYWSTVELAIKQSYIYTGGMTGDMIGAVFTHFVERGWQVIEADYSRYDGHNEVEALNAEMQYYGNVLDPEVIRVLRRQLRTMGRTASGITFKVDGKVASGVINTSFGNTVRGFMIVASYAATRNMPKEEYCVMQLGDDNIIFVKDIERFDLPKFCEHATTMGHKIEAIYRPDPELAEYCSMRFWNIGSGYVLGPKPGRILAKTFVCHDASLTKSDMEAYCVEIARGFKNYRWVPVMGPVVNKLIAKTAKMSPAARKALTSNPYKVTLKEPIEVDWSSVYSQFTKIYGIDPRPIEELLANTDLKMGKAYLHPTLRHIAEVDGACSQQTW